MAKIKLCIVGDKSCDNVKFLKDAIEHFKLDLTNVKEVVSGKNKGGDELGEILAKQEKIKLKEFPTDWKDISSPDALIKENNYGKYNAKAGFQKNQKMAEYADALLCLEPAEHISSQDCIDKFKKLDKPVYVFRGEEREVQTKTKKKYVF